MGEVVVQQLLYDHQLCFAAYKICLKQQIIWIVPIKLFLYAFR